MAAAVRAGRNVTVAGHELAPDDFLVEMRESEGYAVVTEAGYTVGVATAITPELADEGVARELVRRIQDLRREADFELSDRITTWCAGDDTIDPRPRRPRRLREGRDPLRRAAHAAPAC